MIDTSVVLYYSLLFYCLFLCGKMTFFMAMFLVIGTIVYGFRATQLQAGHLHKGVIPNRKRTLNSQDKMRSTYLKEGLLLLHGHGLGIKGPTRTRKLSKLYWRPVPTTD